MLAAHEMEMTVHAGKVRLPGTLSLPPHAAGVVIFAHGSGSSRHSPRNVQVAQALHDRGCATFLFDLLTPPEAADRRNVFDIELLAGRIIAATQSLRDDAAIASLPVGYFGASTGAAAALVGAAHLGEQISAVVSRGGRPDLAGPHLPRVKAATLLLVGSRDEEVLDLNRQAQGMLRCENQLMVIPGATHLFEEPGTLEAVADRAGDWFAAHFAGDPSRVARNH